MQQLQDLYTEKLAHYNAWLLDNKREFGKPYPGFPKQRQIDVLAGLAQPEPVKKARVMKAAPKVAKTARTGTKLEQARALYKPEMAREDVIALFMSELGMSKAGASTYWYMVRK